MSMFKIDLGRSPGKSDSLKHKISYHADVSGDSTLVSCDNCMHCDTEMMEVAATATPDSLNALHNDSEMDSNSKKQGK